jgi:hypothetical protein
VDEHPFRYKGRFSGYSGSYFQEVIQSCGTTVNGYLYAVIHGILYIRKPYRKWKWVIDKLGIKVTNGRISYHPTAANIRNYRQTKDFMPIIKEAEKARKKIKKELRPLSQRSLRGIKVKMCDSISAGHCEAGTISFCKQHRLDPHGEYRAVYLNKNIQDKRLKIVLLKAIQRNKQEKRV